MRNLPVDGPGAGTTVGDVGRVGADPYTDAELIARSRAEPDVFGLIFDRHFTAVRRYLTRFTSVHTADDIAAETFVVAFDNRHRFRGNDHASARPWLFGIATNLARRHLRQRGRAARAYRRLAALSQATDGLASLAAADDGLDAERFRTVLIEAMCELRTVDREVLLLYALADLSYAEVASALRIPLGTVRSRLARARQLMRQRLGPQAGFEGD